MDPAVFVQRGPSLATLLPVFAVHSLLRRFASTVLYADKPFKTPRSLLCLQPDLSMKGGKEIVLLELVSEESTSAKAAQALSAKENEIAEIIKVKGKPYTLIFGPEEETKTDTGVRRVTRIGLIEGIFRYREGVVERMRKPIRATHPRTASRIPPGVEVERR
jgi:hypothetical protein